MVHQIFITIILLMFIVCQTYFLGKKIALNKNLFTNNESAIWMLGIISYLGLTFCAFLPFVWIDLNIIYLIVIFVVKDFLIINYLFFSKGIPFWKNIDFFHLFYILLSTIIFIFIFNFVIDNNFNQDDNFENNLFNYFSKLWINTQNVIKNIGQLEAIFVKKWIFGFLGATVVVASINAFVVRFAKQKNWVDYLISFLLSFFMLIFFNFNQHLSQLLGIYLLLFMLYMSWNIIQFSRKRYSFVFIIIFLVAWIIESKLFITSAALALITILFYTFFQKPMPFLFWIQLTFPILIVLITWFNYWSIFLVYSLIAVLVSFYIFIVSIGNLKSLTKLNNLLIKHYKIWPFLYATTILIITIFVLSFGNVSIADIQNENNLVFDYNWLNNDNQNLINILKIVQGTICVIIYLAMVALLIVWKIFRIKITGWKFISLITITILLLFYNPFFYSILKTINLENNFMFMRILTFVPLILFATIKLRDFKHQLLNFSSL